MTAEELKNLDVSKLVDARGTACPGPLLEAKRALADVEVDGIMEVLSSDDGTISDVSRWCKKMGHDYLGDIEDDSFWHVYFRRTK